MKWYVRIDDCCQHIKHYLEEYDDIFKFGGLNGQIETFSKLVWLRSRTDMNKNTFCYLVNELQWINEEIDIIESSLHCTFDSDNFIIRFFSDIVDIIAEEVCPGCNDNGQIYELIYSKADDEDIEAFYEEARHGKLETENI